MSALAHTLIGERTRTMGRVRDFLLAVTGSLVVAGLAQVYIRLPFTPVPITGQTLGVLLVGASLGARLGLISLSLYLGWGAMGAPVFSQAASGAWLLGFSSVTAGYLWGFVLAAFVVGRLSERGWDRRLPGALGVMLIGELVIFAFGVPWLAGVLDVSLGRALELGLYPFLIGDAMKIALAAGLLPLAWRLTGRRAGNISGRCGP